MSIRKAGTRWRCLIRMKLRWIHSHAGMLHCSLLDPELERYFAILGPLVSDKCIDLNDLRLSHCYDPSNLFLDRFGRPSVYLPVCMMLWGITSITMGITKKRVICPLYICDPRLTVLLYTQSHRCSFGPIIYWFCQLFPLLAGVRN